MTRYLMPPDDAEGVEPRQMFDQIDARSVSHRLDLLEKDLGHRFEGFQKATESTASKEEAALLQKRVAEVGESLDAVLRAVPTKQELVQTREELAAQMVEALKGIPRSPEEFREAVKGMVYECINNPDSQACPTLAKMMSKEEESEEPEGPGHTTPEDYLQCPTCRPKFTQAILEDSDLRGEVLGHLTADERGEVLGHLTEDETSRLILNLRAAGMKIEVPSPRSPVKDIFSA